MAHTTTITTYSAEETAQFGKKIGISVSESWQLDLSDTPQIFCLYGDLGSGKTTFTQGFAVGLGITSRVLSPTFLISKRYSTPYQDRYMYHLDIYRMQSKEQFDGIGLTELMSDTRSCILIEWAEKLESLLPAKRTDLTFSSLSDGSHTIIVETYE